MSTSILVSMNLDLCRPSEHCSVFMFLTDQAKISCTSLDCSEEMHYYCS
ncbi:rCG53378 [Rattus norvegicus]|uniref:RCG53378 n=1 Tax=Rattus norvegicus TaxID=10116 RepID=A6KUP9_RAT|nr:rCG53378 [Rattus norvegicus]